MLVGLGLMVMSIASSIVAPLAVGALMYDDRPAMTIRGINVISRTVRNGEQFVYEFDYDKRAECYPPDGSGEVTYRIWMDEGTGIYERNIPVPLATISYAVPWEHHRITKITIPTLESGHYMMQYHTKFHCKGASADQDRDGPMMAFQVVPAATAPPKLSKLAKPMK